MSSGAPTPSASPEAATLSTDDRRWLHDKYERLAAEEGQLSATRTSYYAAIGTVLLTALVVSISDFLNEPGLLLTVVTFLSLLGILISVIWASLLHRTNDAQNLWREAARSLEETYPPVPGDWQVPIHLRSGDTMSVNLFRPFETHDERFSPTRGISWIDRLNPSKLTEILPVAFILVWVTVLGGAWFWWLALR